MKKRSRSSYLMPAIFIIVIFVAYLVVRDSLDANKYDLFALILLVIAIGDLAIFVFGLYRKDLNKCMKKYSITKENLEYDMTNANEIGDVFIGENYVVYAGQKSFVLPLNKLIDVYSKADKNQPQLSIIQFVTDDGCEKTVVVKKKDIATAVVDVLKK